MTNAKDDRPQLHEASFFLIGDSGSGKTRMAGSFPAPYFFDFDKGMASLAGSDVQYDTFKDTTPKAGVAMPARGIYKYGEGYPAFLKKINELGDLIDKGECPYQTLVIDSATMLSDLVMNYVLKEDAKSGAPVQIQHWGRQTELLRTIFDQFTAWPIIKIITAHIQRNTNDLLQTTEMLPLLTGKFAAKSSIYFDEVYFLEIEEDKAHRGTDPKHKLYQHVIRTQSTPIRKAARSRFQVPDGTVANYQAVKAALEKK